jgi:hypothetical protein
MLGLSSTSIRAAGCKQSTKQRPRGPASPTGRGLPGRQVPVPAHGAEVGFARPLQTENTRSIQRVALAFVAALASAHAIAFFTRRFLCHALDDTKSGSRGKPLAFNPRGDGWRAPDWPVVALCNTVRAHRTTAGGGCSCVLCVAHLCSCSAGFQRWSGAADMLQTHAVDAAKN